MKLEYDELLSNFAFKSNLRRYSVGLCALGNIREAAESMLATLPRPSRAPPAHVIRAPIWTTWARYKTGVDAAKVLKFAEEIRENELPGSVMEIDDKWQEAYGELDFDKAKFPDPKVGPVTYCSPRHHIPVRSRIYLSPLN